VDCGLWTIDYNNTSALPCFRASVFCLLTYEIGRIHSIIGNNETSLFYLEQSIINGFSDIKRLNNDPDLKKLHNEDRFKDLIKIWERLNENISEKS